MILVHLSDVHIKSLKDHEQYKEAFDRLFILIKERKPNLIINCGDTAHSKTNISPEFVNLCSYFLKGLADIAPTLVILGNHDGNLKNLSREDAISPIVRLLNHENLILMKNSDKYETEYIDFHCISRFDDKVNFDLNEDKLNVGLFHGSVTGCKTDGGFQLKSCEADLSFFQPFDFVMLGDIHKRQFLDKDKRIAYPGSLIQQNFGEEEIKGFLYWTICTRTNYRTRFVELPNKNPYITTNLVESETSSIFFDRDIPETCKLRVKVDESLWNKRKMILTKLTDKQSVEIKMVKNQISDKIQTDLLKKKEFNLKELISKFEEDEEKQNKILYEVEDIKQKLKIKNKNFLSSWSIQRLKWSNFFNYEDNNEIDFGKYNSEILSIVGKNFSGKSSIIDTLLYSIFGIITKNIKKNSQIINNKKDNASCSVEIIADGKIYKIERELTDKHSNLDFFCDGLCLNGMDKNETETNIKNLFGTAEHFLLSTIVSQFDCFQFINSTSSKRKEQLISFLDISEFELLGESIRDIFRDLKTEKKFLDASEPQKAMERLLKQERELSAKQEDHESRRELYKSNLTLLEAYNKQIKDLKVISKDLVSKTEEEFKSKIFDLNDKKISLIGQKINLVTRREKAQLFVDKFSSIDSSTIFSEKKEHEQWLQSLEKTKNELKIINGKKSVLQRGADSLSDAPCEDVMKNICPFAKNAVDNSKLLNLVLMDEISLELRKESLDKQEMKFEQFKENWNIFQEMKQKNSDKMYEISKLNGEIQLIDSKIEKINDLFSEIQKYGRESYISFPILCDEEFLYLFNEEETGIQIEKKILEQRMEEQEIKVKEYEKFIDRFSLLEVMSKIFHNNGIISMIIEDFIPYINEKVNQIIQDLVPFEIKLENNKDKLEILIKNDLGERSIELCSGSEKSFAAMAIRIALTKLGNIPYCNIFILDEPATSLDSEHLQQFSKFLNQARDEFDVIVLITHLEQMKEFADNSISVVVNEEGYAKLE